MLAADHYPYIHPNIAMPNHELFEIHRSKISLHRAKADYHYPSVRLPHRFSGLAGLSTRIYQTVHHGALAFLVVVSPTDTLNNAADGCENDSACTKSSAFTRRRSGVRIAAGPSFLFAIGYARAPSSSRLTRYLFCQLSQRKRMDLAAQIR
jgi:hypothetical protein